MRRLSGGLGAALIMGFLYAPVIVLVIFAFQGSARLALPFDGPSLRWFHLVFNDPVFRASLSSSLKVGLAASVIAVIIGTLASLGLTRHRLRFGGAIRIISVAPIALPGLFLGEALLTYFPQIGLQLSLVTVLLAHLLYVLPFLLIAINSRMERFDVSVEEVARDLGANPWNTFWLVTFPLTWPTILAGGVLAFALSFDEFVITNFVVGSNSTLPIMVWSRMRRTIDPSVNAIATLLLAVFVGSLAVSGLLLRIRQIRGHVR